MDVKEIDITRCFIDLLKPEEGPAVYSLAKSSKFKEKSIGQDVYLCVVPFNVRNGDKTAQTYALLDPASTVTLFSEHLVKYFGVTGKTRDITLRTIGQRPIQYKSISGSSVVSPLDGGAEQEITDVLSVEKIPAKPNKAPDQRFLRMMPHLHDERLPILEGGTVNLLINADNEELVCFQDVRSGPRKSPKAMKTVLVWSLFGPSFESPSDIRAVHFASDHYVNFVKCNDLEIQTEIETLWTTDFGNETSVLDIPNSREDRAVYEIVKYIGGHCQLPFPWRTGMQDLPDNKEMAKKRLRSLKNRLMRDSDLHKRYVEVIQGYITAGYAKIVGYLPHFPVMNQHKPGKVRVVFDAAAKYGNVSLNDCLMSGPDLVSSLLGVILRFCRGRIALVADVEAMFHQVRVTPQNTDALRLLWWDDEDISNEPVPHRMRVHIFGTTSSPFCAAFCLKQTVVKFGNKNKPRISEIVNEDFYVDDCLTTAESVDEGIEIFKELIQLMSKGRFNLTKWLTNNDELLSMIPEEKRAKCVQNHVIDGNVK
ncbi:uncharacterized protein LOC144427252 [Styela clava]